MLNLLREPSDERRAVVLAWLLLSALTSLPYLRAALDAPLGRVFVGFFFFVDDSYNYLSFVQQAEDGSILFRNKLVTEDHAPALINVEWWLVGRVSSILGHHPAVVFRLLGLGASLALLVAVDRWLRLAGLPSSHSLPALVLVAVSGGLGGVFYWFTGRLMPDVGTGLFPFLEVLTNPHFVTGTSLLLWLLLWTLSSGGPLRVLKIILGGSILGLVRPYDLVTFACVWVLGVVLTERPGSWLKNLWPLLGLVPACLYEYWVFYRNPAFAFYAKIPYAFPPTTDLLAAVAPGALLGLGALWTASAGQAARRVRVYLWSWVLLGLLLIVVHPVFFSLQFLVGFGVPLLALSALGLSRFKPWVTLVVTLLLSGTALATLTIVLNSNPYWHVPADRMEAALALRGHCHQGDLALAPSDIGLYMAGLTACKAYISHRVSPEFGRRAAEVNAFYSNASSEERSAFLDRLCVSFVALPGDPGPVPKDWLGERTPFRAVAHVGNPISITLYGRPDPATCVRP